MTEVDPTTLTRPVGILPAARSRARIWFVVVCYLYVVGVLCLWWILQWADSWWLATILLFSPRLVVGLPLLVLVPVSYLLGRRLVFTLLVLVSLVVLFPYAGGCIPWRTYFEKPGSQQIRVLSCNMHYTIMDSTPLETLIRQVQPDVIALQEWDEANDSELLGGNDWYTHKEYALFLASRYPIRRVQRLGEHSSYEEASVALYEVETPGGILSLISLHLDSPRIGIYQAIHRKGQGTNRIHQDSELRRRQSLYIADHAAKIQGPLVLVGDFNTPADSQLFREVWGHYRDAFSHSGWGWGYTYWGSKTMVRIDHILCANGVRSRRCWIGGDIGSPHYPVIADLCWD